jgi:hypothetical protein
MNQRKKQILSMDLDEVSLVGSGDNVEAKVVISKAAHDEKNTDGTENPTTLFTTGNSEEYDMPEDISSDDLPQEVADYLEGLEELVADAIDSGFLGDVDGESDDEDAYEPVLVEKAEPELEDILKSHPEIALIVKAAEERAEVAEAIAKHERDVRIEREMVEKAASLTFVSDNRDELANLLRSLYEVAPEEAEVVEKMFRTANSQLRESAIFKEMGSGLPGLSDPVRSEAEAIRKEDPSLTAEQAEALAFERNPHLYADELKGH